MNVVRAPGWLPAWNRLQKVSGFVPDRPQKLSTRRGRIAVVPRRERELQLVAQARVDRQVRPDAPRVLDEEPCFPHARALDRVAQVFVLAAVFTQRRIARRSESRGRSGSRTAPAPAAAARPTRRGNSLASNIPSAGRRWQMRQPSIVRHHLLVLQPQVVLRPRAAHAEAVFAPQPLDVFSIRASKHFSTAG